jgi:hypothetical protein
MHKYRRPLLAIAAVTAVATLLSACIVVPRGHYRHHRHYGAAAPDVAPQAAPTAPVAG